MLRSARNTLFASVVTVTLFLAACGSDDNNGASSWGTDRLGSAVLSPGESATLGLSAGCYDVHAVSSMENFKEAYWMGQTFSGDVTTVTIADGDWEDIAE